MLTGRLWLLIPVSLEMTWVCKVLCVTVETEFGIKDVILVSSKEQAAKFDPGRFRVSLFGNS